MRLFIFTLGVLLLCLETPNTLNAQSITSQGNEFWFSFIESGPNNNDIYSIFISATDNGTAILSSPAGDYLLEENYIKDEVTEIRLKDSIWGPIGSNEITNYGLSLKTTSDVGVYIVNFQTKQSEASIIYPIEIINSDYIITTAAISNNVRTFIIVATEDETTIEIHSSDITSEIVLDKGETYQLHSNKDLTGTRITAFNNKKIAVFSGSRSTKICPTGTGGSNPLFDQLLPIELLGLEYALIPFQKQDTSLVKITAISDQTEITLNSNYLVNLNENEIYSFPLDEAGVLRSSKKIQVSHMSCSNDSIGDPSLLHLVPINKTFQFGNVESLQGFDSNDIVFEHRYITLISKTSDIDDVLFNSNSISSEFINIGSENEYSYATIEIDNKNNIIFAPKGVNGFAYGFGLYDAYTFSLGFSDNNILSTNSKDTPGCSIFPNPVSHDFNINCEDYDKLTLIDKLGREVFETPYIESNKISMNQFEAGIYYLKIHKNNKEIYFEKINKLN